MSSEATPPPPEQPAQASLGSPTQYEFSPRENEVIGKLGSNMFFVGIFMLVVSVLVVVQGLVRHEPASVIFALIYLCVGSLTVAAAASFKDVVRTQGNDIPLLMDALEKLRWIYTIQYWFILVAIILSVIVLLISQHAL
jgi:hypothetical protein